MRTEWSAIEKTIPGETTRFRKTNVPHPNGQNLLNAENVYDKNSKKCTLISTRNHLPHNYFKRKINTINGDTKK